MKIETRTILGAKCNYIEVTVVEGGSRIQIGLLDGLEARELVDNMKACIEDLEYLFREV